VIGFSDKDKPFAKKFSVLIKEQSLVFLKPPFENEENYSKIVLFCIW